MLKMSEKVSKPLTGPPSPKMLAWLERITQGMATGLANATKPKE
jgi:hypothetical protein